MRKSELKSLTFRSFASIPIITFMFFFPSFFSIKNLYLLIIEAVGLGFVSYVTLLIFTFQQKSMSKNKDLEKIVEYVAKKLKMKEPKILISKIHLPEAGVFRFFTYTAIIYYEDVLNVLQDKELIAVTMHEFAHLKNHDPEKSLIFLIIYNVLFQTVAYYFNSSIIATVLFFAFFPISNYFQRFKERKADIDAVKDEPRLAPYLESALIKMEYLKIKKQIPDYDIKEIPLYQLYFLKEKIKQDDGKRPFLLSVISIHLGDHPALSERLKYLSKFH